MDAFNIPYRKEQKLFKNLAIFDFESICVKEESYRQTETTTWIAKHVPISISISSNLIPEHIFLCNANPHHLILSFITALEGLATQSKAQMKLNFIEVETAIKIKLCAIMEQLNQRRNQAERVSNFADDCMVEEEEKNLSTQFLKMQKNQLIDLQEHFERYCNVLPIFGFNSAKYDINLIKLYLLPILVNDRDIEPTVIRKPISLFLSSLETFTYLTLSISSAVLPVLTLFSKLTRSKRQRVSSRTSGSIVQRK